LKQLIDLKIDYAFKLIFGKPGNEPILIAFLNATLKLTQENKITSVILLNNELDKEYKDDKKSVLDIRAVTGEGIQVNIEIQLANHHDMEKRTLFYWAKMYTLQLNEGMAYQELAKTITINIIDFNYILQTRSYHSVFRLFEIEEGFELTEALEIHFMELPKFIIKWRAGLVSPWEDALARWLFLLEGSENEEIFQTLEVIAMQDPVLNQAMEEWEKSSDDPKVREIYFARQKAVLDEKAAIRAAELRLQEAIKQGKEEGIREGIRENKLDVAKNLLARGMEIRVISEIVGISEEEIRNLK